MNRFFTLVLGISISCVCIGQKTNSAYPSLLWEITGNGLTRPSYLFGTMHVSNKLAFHLSDSFYHAIASCSTVSLELDPRQWQSEMFRLQQSQTAMASYTRPPSEYLREKSFQLISNYENKIKRALSEEPYIVNGLLYRTMEGQSNFQENTYLDLYVYQTARKLGKKATGVENYMESEKIQLEAQEDMMKERNRRINFNNENPYELQRKIQDAYRRGDLSLLDSLSQLSGSSDSYNEKFLYGRNDIQANSIDSILRRESLFVAVGAAHLPGKRGVIEILRRKGYTLRPVMMSDRNAEQRDRIDKIRVPVKMSPVQTEDGFLQLSVPGQLFRRTEVAFTESWQYADMENGAYYMLSRIKTHPGHPDETMHAVMRKTDSLLYEYIPGKIIQKKMITVSGYKGLDIVNKTRRGDIQRYHIIYTPQEVLVCKMSGNEDYVNGKEADEFFSSIRLKEPVAARWTHYSPPAGGFMVSLPHPPGIHLGKAAEDMLDTRQYEAIDPDNGDAYTVWHKTLHNYNFLEEDTIDLHLISESLKSSEMIEKELSRKYGKQNGYPCLDIQYSLTNGGILQARAVIRGAQYYLLTATGKEPGNGFTRFFNSFRMEDIRYKPSVLYTDSALGFSVRTPVEPAIDKDLKDYLNRRQYNAISVYLADRYQPRSLPRNAYFKNDTTGESVHVSAIIFPKYYYQKDSARFWETELGWQRLKDDLVITEKKFTVRPDASLMFTYMLTDTNTTRQIKCMAILDGHALYRIQAMTDRAGRESSFIRDFFSSFQPIRQKDRETVFASKSDVFFADLHSADSTVQKIAKSAINLINWEPEDFARLKKSFYALQTGTPDYLSTKTRLIQAIGFIRDTADVQSRINWLQQAYTDFADTSIYQNAALQALAHIQTKEAYQTLKTTLIENPAIFDNNFEYQSLFRSLGDSLQLAAGLYPEILPLTALDDYKQPVTALLTKLVDSGYIAASAYESQFSKLFFDAQIQARKLQMVTERELIRNQTEPERGSTGLSYNNPNNNANNLLLGTYLNLLIPFYDQHPQVARFFDKLLQTGDINTKLASAVLLARHNKPVPDTLWAYIAASDMHRISLYEKLDKIGKLILFPRPYKTQQAMSRSLLLNSRSYYRTAEIQPAGQRYVETKKTNGWVYLFKYRLQKQGDWLMGLSGIQPSDTAKVNTDRSIVSMNNRKLQTNGTEEAQFDKLVKQSVLGKRKSAAVFYNEARVFEDISF